MRTAILALIALMLPVSLAATSDASLRARQNALVTAIQSGDGQAVARLLDGGLGVDARLDTGTPLESAIAFGRTEIVGLLLARGADPNARGIDGVTPLMRAAEAGNERAVRLLLANGADRALRDDLGKNASDYAKREGHDAIVKLLASRGPVTVPPPTRADLDRDLVRAAAEGNVAQVRALLANGASAKATLEGTDMTVLQMAVAANRADVVSALLDAGADVNAKGPGGLTPLMAATNADMVRLLVARGANVNAKAIGGQTALVLASGSGKTEIVKALTAAGARLDATSDAYTDVAKQMGVDPAVIDRAAGPHAGEAHARSRHSVQALAGAARSGDVETMRLLLGQGAPVNGQDGQGRTPLLHAARADRLAAARLLVERGANVDRPADDGERPLLAAAANGNAELAALLLSKNAAVDVANRRGDTPLMMAVFAGSLPIVRQLLDAGANVGAADALGQTAFFRTSSIFRIEKDAEILKLLLARGADPNARTKDGLTALMRAANLSTTEVVRLLLDRGARIDARDAKGSTVLHHAIGSNAYRSDTVRLLIEKGADVNAASKTGVTPLMLESEPGVVRELIRRGAEVNRLDANGRNALHWRGRAHGCSPDAAAVLLERGIAVDVKAKDGSTPYAVAVANGCDDVAKLLVKAGAK